MGREKLTQMPGPDLVDLPWDLNKCNEGPCGVCEFDKKQSENSKKHTKNGSAVKQGRTKIRLTK